MNNPETLADFLLSLGFSQAKTGNLFTLNKPPISLLFVPTSEEFINQENTETIILHEDIWKTRTHAVKNRLQSLAGLNKPVHARKSQVERINQSVAQAFMEEFHVGGFIQSYYKFGLFQNNELLAVALFSKPRKFDDNTLSGELTRFATRTGIRITGGLNKLITAYLRHTKINHLMTYADKEWTQGNTYYQLGFTCIENTKPLSFYIHKQTGERIAKSKWNGNLSEDWVEKSNRGNLKLVLKKNPR
jgi:hypothetical protein